MAYTCLIVRGTTYAVLFLRWPRVAAAGALVGFSTVAFVYLATFVLIVSDGTLLAEGAVNGRPDTVRNIVGVWGARAFFLLAAIFAASWVVRGAGERPVIHGLSVGLVAALAQQGFVQLGAPPVELGELVSYLMLGAAVHENGGCGGRRKNVGFAGPSIVAQGRDGYRPQKQRSHRPRDAYDHDFSSRRKLWNKGVATSPPNKTPVTAPTP